MLHIYVYIDAHYGHDFKYLLSIHVLVGYDIQSSDNHY